MLLIPGDIFARRNVAPVLQQIESAWSQDFSANDCFKPVSKYWDRINRPDQLLTALPEALRVLTSPAETGAVTLALPQDVQTEAYDYPVAFFRKRVWHIMRNRPDRAALAQAAELIRASKKPMIVAGGGVIYSEATEALRQFVDATGIPVGETMAGKGSLRWDHPLNLGAVGVTGTFAANRIAKEADLVIGIGTRYSDFTTRVQDRLAEPGRPLHQHQRHRVRRGQASWPAGGGRRPGRRWRNWADMLAGYAVDPAYRAEATAAARRLGRRGAAHLRHPPEPAAQPGRADRRAQRRLRSRRDHAERGRLDAGRPAQAVAGDASQELPPGIRQ